MQLHKRIIPMYSRYDLLKNEMTFQEDGNLKRSPSKQKQLNGKKKRIKISKKLIGQQIYQKKIQTFIKSK